MGKKWEPGFPTFYRQSFTERNAVTVGFDGTNVRFTFDIPRCNDGSQAQLDTRIRGTSDNTNGATTLDTGFGDPDMEALRQKLNEMILNERRSFPTCKGPGSGSVTPSNAFFGKRCPMWSALFGICAGRRRKRR